MRLDTERILTAMRADCIPPGECGLWSVWKGRFRYGYISPEADRWILPGNYTYLSRFTEETLHTPHGECVMLDADEELLTHMEFVRRAHGKVLITGLGLGCVARGVLTKSCVDSVTVVERDPAVIRLVGPYMPNDPRLGIVCADALSYVRNGNGPWDSAWHDLWSDPDSNEDHLTVTHAKLIARCWQRVSGFHSAWKLPRFLKRRFSLEGRT